jgi:hypothetical protein
MTQSCPMTIDSVATPTTDCIFATILGFMLPFFLAGAAGNQQIATIAIRELIDAYNARTPTELDLVGRIVGFSIAAMDNLRLSMAPGLSDTKVLRYRANAVTLCRSSDTARKMLDALQAGQEVKRDVPRPSIATAPPAPRPVPPVNAPATAKLPNAGASELPTDIDTMKRDARTMMAAFSRNGGQGTVSPLTPDTATMVRAAARAAVAAATRTPAA